MNKFITWNFWFNPGPGHLLPIYRNGLVIFIFILSAVSIAANRFAKKQDKELRKFFVNLKVFSLTNAFVGAMLLFFNYELTPFFSSRFWYIIWGVTMLAWAIIISKDLRGLEEKRVEREKRKEFRKYIP